MATMQWNHEVIGLQLCTESTNYTVHYRQMRQGMIMIQNSYTTKGTHRPHGLMKGSV